MLFAHRQEADHREFLLRPPATPVGGEEGDLLVGWAVGLLRRHGPHRCSGRFYALSVHPDFRGRGLGAQLAQNILGQLRRRGAQTFSLEVRTPNPAAQGLYQRLGFHPGGPLPDYYGTGLHGLRMRK